MKLQGKITVTLLLVSLATTAMVGGVAYWMVLREFNQSVQGHAFGHFQQDMTAYLTEYGSLDAARKAEPFPVFINRTRKDRPEPVEPGDFHIPRGETHPFKFLLISPEGAVMESAGGYNVGDTVQEDIRKEGRPIEVRGRTVAYAVPIGDTILSDADKAYLEAIRRALITSMLLAGPFALVIGLLLGRAIAKPLRELTSAIRSMREEGEIRQEVPVRSSDEIGMLAESFNTMTKELSLVHNELKESSERIQEQALEMRELSIRDHLTGLYNRRHFDEQAEKVYQNMVRYKHPLSVMMCDLDHFKKVNDRYSHALGDKVLKRFAGIVRANSRAADITARYGGEEFVILYPETSAADALVSCEKLRRAVEDHPWDELQEGLGVTISVGLSGDMSLGSVENMLKEADERLYHAKDTGRNRVVSVLAGA